MASSSIRRWWYQYAALTIKSWKVLWRRKSTFATFLLSPPISVLVLYLLASIGHHGGRDRKDQDSQLATVPSALSRCVVIGQHNRQLQLPKFYASNSSSPFNHCVSIGYVSDTANQAVAVMREVARLVSLNYGTDIVEFSDAKSMSRFMWENPGHVDLVLSFTPDDFRSYEIWLNSSMSTTYADYDPFLKKYGVSARLLTLQQSVNMAIIRQVFLQEQQKPLELNVSMQIGAFTDIESDDETNDDETLGQAVTSSEDQLKPRNRCDLTPVKEQTITSIGGSTILAAGVGISSILVLMTIVSEKQKNLIGKLRQMGLQESAYIASWSSVFLLLAVLSSLMTAIVMKLTAHRLYLFHYASFMVLLFVVLAFFVGMIGLALILSALFTKPVWVMSVSSIVFFGILFSTFWLNLRDGSYDVVDRNSNCFRMANGYDNIWAPHTPTHFFEFLIFWFPWIEFGRIFLRIYTTTVYGSENFSWKDLEVKTSFYDPERAVHVTPPLLISSSILMFLLFVVSMALNWYISQAFSSRTNGRKPWFFPFQRGYWSSVTRLPSYQPGDVFAEEREKSRSEESLRVFKLSKTYKSGTALREVSVTMNKGEVFALLGHNGAGKSTMINILTGLTQPTHGEVYFAGHSLKSDMSQIQAFCGICPQFDALWDELNAKDHLHVCAAMQGLCKKEASHAIGDVLEAVNLTAEGEDMVTTFSGGMKRRLSVAMAALGEHRRMIFFDEPTTGVDTINRKRIWQLIERLKQDKVVILTTHNMEEADALGDRIAILHQGTIKAVGSSLFLKKQFGSGYQVSLLLASAERTTEVAEIVRRVLPGAKIVQSSAGNVKVSLNQNSALGIPKLLAELRVVLPSREITRPYGSCSLIKEWGISNTTLEEVFLTLSARNNQQVDEDKDATAEDAENLCLICGTTKAEMVTLYTRSGISVKVPNAICLTCALASQPEEDEEAKVEAQLVEPSKDPDEEVALEALTIDVEAKPDASQRVGSSSKSGFALFRSQIHAVFYKNFKLNLAQKKALIFFLVMYLVYLLLMKFLSTPTTGTQRGSASCPGRSDLTDTCSPQQFNMQDLGVSWGMFAPQTLSNTSATSSNQVSWSTIAPVVWYSSGGNLDLTISAANATMVKQQETTDFNQQFISGQERLRKGSVPGSSIQSPVCPVSATGGVQAPLFSIADLPSANATFDSLFPSSGIAFSTEASRTGNTIQVSSITRYKSTYHSYSSGDIWVRVPSLKQTYCRYYPGTSVYKDLVLLHRNSPGPKGISGIAAPFLAADTIMNAVIGAVAVDKTPIKTTLKEYPQLVSVQNSEADPPYGALMFIVMGLSTFFPLFVRRLLMERETGLLEMVTIAGMRPAAYWFGNYLYDFLLSVLAGCIFFVIGRVVAAVDADPFLLAVVTIVWAHALNGLTTFTVCFFKSVRAASLFAVVAKILCAVGSVFINAKYGASDRMPAKAALFPPIALSRILWLILSGQGREELTVDIIVLFLSSTALYFIGVFVNEFRASHKKVFDFGKLFMCKSPARESGTEDLNDDDDSDVVMEKERVKTASASRFAIKTEGLSKVYAASAGKTKTAVDSLTLGLEYGEIFGLLGANGAGKTTVLSMLSGSLPSSGGTIEIGGKRITRKNQIPINGLSICPQSDVVWKDLSVWSHFMFYAYVKGLNRKEARAAVQNIAAEIELSGDSFQKPASSLSGGQLRRLTFGVSLIGSPSILLMDEITTGLDPVSRSTIWTVVKKQSNAGRLILLTTHSMEEADTLCSRIGIMSHGNLKCLGAPLYLKNRYSHGYTLTIVTQAHGCANESLDAFIKQAADDVTLTYAWQRVRKYSIKAFDLKYLFQLLEDDLNKSTFGIREWQIEQTTLQDVFLHIAHD